MTGTLKHWDIPALLQELRAVYERKNDISAWDVEKDSIEKQLDALSKHLSQQYTSPSILDRGGSGILIKTQTARLHNQPRVIKFPRPLPENAPEFAALLDNEIRLLAEMRSHSVVVIHEAGRAPLSEPLVGLYDVPFYIMDFVDGKDSTTYIKNNVNEYDKLYLIIRETIAAVEYLHQHKLVHMDIKPANILINNSGHPVLVDLGTTKRLSSQNIETKIACTYIYAAEKLKQYLTEGDDQSRTEGCIKRSEISHTWDIHSLGLTIREWIDLYLSKNIYKITPYQKKYILLMALRMNQDFYNNSTVKEYGLQSNLLSHLRYKEIGQVLVDVDKLSSGNDLSSIIPEFDINHHKTIQGGSREPTTFTDRLAKTLNHPIVSRLAKISQLGIVQLVYPTCTHSRFEHSLGTYHNVIKYIYSLYYDPLNPIFRQIMEPKHYRAALLAALLHDIGQFPLAHDFEDIESSLFSHSALVKSMIYGERNLKVKGTKKIEFHSLDEIFKLWDVSKEDVIGILQAKTNEPNHGLRQRIIKSLISGPIDADKIDYLLRDGRQLRVPYAEGIDFERLLHCLTLVIKDHANGVLAYVGVHEKGRIPAEYVTFGRYAMFAQIYWHHTVRSAKAMLSRSVSALIASFDKPEEQNRFRYNFESFVLSGLSPSNTHRQAQRSLFIASIFEKKEHDHDINKLGFNISRTTLNAWDLSVLNFVKNALVDRNLIEAELVKDLIERKLYKRVFVFSRENDKDVWDGFTKQWNDMKHADRRDILADIEGAILEAAGRKLDSDKETIFLTKDHLKSMEMRISANRPLILLDVPKSKPGAKLSLEYVVEEDRRALRKSNRICGRSVSDPLWKGYAEKLWEKAGRIRVFVHPDFIDPVRSAVNKGWMRDVLGNLSAVSDPVKKEKIAS